jgi:hypothetical protein
MVKRQVRKIECLTRPLGTGVKNETMVFQKKLKAKIQIMYRRRREVLCDSETDIAKFCGDGSQQAVQCNRYSTHPRRSSSREYQLNKLCMFLHQHSFPVDCNGIRKMLTLQMANTNT